jgi:hypothetical protein
MLGPKTVDCIFLGYAHNSAAYRFLVIKSEVADVHVNNMIESRDATFFEDVFPMKSSSSSSSSQSTNFILDSPKLIDQPHEENDSTEHPRRSKRQRVEKSFGDDFTVYLVDDTPKTLSEAYASTDVEYWKEAVHSEMESLMSNETW